METLDLLIGRCPGKQDLGNNCSWAPKREQLAGSADVQILFYQCDFPLVDDVVVFYDYSFSSTEYCGVVGASQSKVLLSVLVRLASRLQALRSRATTSIQPL